MNVHQITELVVDSCVDHALERTWRLLSVREVNEDANFTAVQRFNPNHSLRGLYRRSLVRGLVVASDPELFLLSRGTNVRVPSLGHRLLGVKGFASSFEKALQLIPELQSCGSVGQDIPVVQLHRCARRPAI